MEISTWRRWTGLVYKRATGDPLFLVQNECDIYRPGQSINALMATTNQHKKAQIHMTPFGVCVCVCMGVRVCVRVGVCLSVGVCVGWLVDGNRTHKRSPFCDVMRILYLTC